MLLSLALTLLAAASPPDSLTAIHGVWVNDSTTVIETPLPDDAGGGVLAQTIHYRYLVVSDSALTETSVWEDSQSAGLQAATTTTRYEREGAQLRIGDVLVDVIVEGDRLTTSTAYGSTMYRRSRPTTTPGSLLGTWVVYVTDDAGVTIDLAFVFSEDGTLRVGFEDPRPFRALDDFLLFADDQDPVDLPTGRLELWEVARYEVIGPDRVNLVMPTGETTPLERLRPRD
ncbi:MAG: hypothetical protein AAFP15_03790 [Bacteroidota bacterium]